MKIKVMSYRGHETAVVTKEEFVKLKDPRFRVYVKKDKSTEKDTAYFLLPLAGGC